MTATEKRKLTKRTIDAVPSPSGDERIVIHDSEVKGFSIRISSGSRTFYLYRWIGGRPQRIKLGGYPETTPEAARKLAEKSNGEVAQGKDLAADRRRRRLPNSNDPTLGKLLTHTLEQHWKPNCRTWKEQKRLFEKYSPAKWNSRRLSTISKVDVLERHRVIGKDHGVYLANRWRGIIHRLFSLATDDFDFLGGNV